MPAFVLRNSLSIKHKWVVAPAVSGLKIFHTVFPTQFCWQAQSFPRTKKQEFPHKFHHQSFCGHCDEHHEAVGYEKRAPDQWGRHHRCHLCSSVIKTILNVPKWSCEKSPFCTNSQKTERNTFSDNVLGLWTSWCPKMIPADSWTNWHLAHLTQDWNFGMWRVWVMSKHDQGSMGVLMTSHIMSWLNHNNWRKNLTHLLSFIWDIFG